jgi:predicted component of type VI protein secretion system
MKITIELPDDLYRQARAEAAVRGRTLKDIVAEGLRIVLAAPRKTKGQRSLARLMRHGRGIVNSGVSDLASNPDHVASFGRDARRHR